MFPNLNPLAVISNATSKTWSKSCSFGVNPNFLAWDRSNLFSFTRQSDNGKWERSLGFKVFEPSPDVLTSLRKENEDLTIFDLWKMPSDEDFLKISEVVNKISDEYRDARGSIISGVSTVNEVIADDVPF